MQVYSIAPMTATTNDPIRRVLAAALLVFPCLFILVFLMHFRRPADFFHFRLHYVQSAAGTDGRSPDPSTESMADGA